MISHDPTTELEARYTWLKDAVRASLGTEALVFFGDLGMIQTIVVTAHGRSSVLALQGAVKQRSPTQYMMLFTHSFCLAEESDEIRAGFLAALLAPFRDTAPSESAPLHPKVAN